MLKLPFRRASESMLRPMPGGRSTSGYRPPAFAPVDYTARLRVRSETIAGQRQEVRELRETFKQEKAEIKAHPPTQPYAVRKAFHQLDEAQRKLAKEKEALERKTQFQRAKADADAVMAEKKRSTVI